MRTNKKQSEKLCLGLIPELCRLTGFNEDMRTNYRLMKAVVESTRLSPQNKLDRLKIFNNRLSQSEKSVKVFDEWRMQIDRNVYRINGRILKPELIIFGKERFVETKMEADWTHEMKTRPMYSIMNLSHWALIYPAHAETIVREFMWSLISTASNMHMIINDPKIRVKLTDDHLTSYIKAIDQCCAYNPALIMCVVPTVRADLYAAIKRKSCVEHSVPTQVILTKTMASSSQLSVATKVAIQIRLDMILPR
jgi:aubergine-like protein